MDAGIPSLRRDTIAARLAQGQPVVAAVLAAEFSVSEDAIRRDLRALAAKGRCRRVYGGALPVSAATAPMAARVQQDGDRKATLARAAVGVVGPGEVLFLDNGSTNLALVDLLPEDADLTVVTNSVEIASATMRRQDLKLILVGGSVDPTVGGCVDGAATEMVGRMRFDRTFLGACSVSIDFGVGAFHFTDATFKRAVLEVSRDVIVLATTDKLDARTPHRAAALNRVAILVVESSTTPEQRARLEQAGCRVLIAADQ